MENNSYFTILQKERIISSDQDPYDLILHQENKVRDNISQINSNDYITDSENVESHDSQSNLENKNKEFICEFYQAIKDDNINFLEEFVKTETNLKCMFSNYI